MVRSAAPGEPPPVLLVGGSAGTGTAAAAGELARDLGVMLLRSDATWLALKEVTSREQQPALHLFPGLEGAEGMTAQDLVDQFARAASVVCGALEPSLRFQAYAGPGLVVEGAWLLPAFASRLAAVGEGAARPAFLFESSREETGRAMIRESGMTGDGERLERLAGFSFEYGGWLKNECRRLGIPVVDARPRETVALRLREALRLDAGARAEVRG